MLRHGHGCINGCRLREAKVECEKRVRAVEEALRDALAAQEDKLRSVEAVHGQHIREQEFTIQGLTGRLQQQQALCQQRDEDIQRLRAQLRHQLLQRQEQPPSVSAQLEQQAAVHRMQVEQMQAKIDRLVDECQRRQDERDSYAAQIGQIDALRNEVKKRPNLTVDALLETQSTEELDAFMAMATQQQTNLAQIFAAATKQARHLSQPKCLVCGNDTYAVWRFFPCLHICLCHPCKEGWCGRAKQTGEPLRCPQCNGEVEHMKQEGEIVR